MTGLTSLRVQGRDASATNVLAENEELNTSMLLSDYNLVSQREPGNQVLSVLCTQPRQIIALG